MRAIVFDLDGTLVETAPDLHLILVEVMRGIDLPAPALTEVRGMIGDGARALIERALAAAGRPPDPAELDQLYDVFIERYTAAPCRASHAYAGVPAALDALRADGAKLGVCTNKPQRPSELLLEALDLADRFDAVVGGDVLPVRKPDPLHLDAVVRALGARPVDTVMVGDSRNDLATARALGVPCILVSFGYTTVPAAELGADMVIDHFDALPAALDRVRRIA